MAVATTTELTAISPTGFEEALKHGVARAKKTLRNVKSCWIKDQELLVAEDGADQFKVTMKVTFVLDD
ncbi:dodecin domain-containing protein [Rhodobacterales bacterium HKCCE3408]|nr:dodecin domain-containing protein [Rhodobacterales bacterium HKCCE3408]